VLGAPIEEGGVWAKTKRAARESEERVIHMANRRSGARCAFVYIQVNLNMGDTRIYIDRPREGDRLGAG